MTASPKLIRITTVPMSFNLLLKHQLRYMSSHYQVMAVSSPGDDLSELADREAVRIQPVAMTRSITVVQDLKALWKLYLLFRKERPTIVHTHTPKAGLLGMFAARLAGVPVRIHTVAGMPLLKTTGTKRAVLNFVERWTYLCAHKVYPNSLELKHLIMRNRLCREPKLKVIGHGSSNGIDTNYFDPVHIDEQQKETLRDQLKFSAVDKVFCFSGRLVKDKGINELVSVFVHLNRIYPTAKLLLVGWLEEELDPLSPVTIAMIHEHPAIKWVGYQKDIRPYLAISHAVVFPSHREGFPNVPMQAGAMGIPCIVSDINGCNEIIRDGCNGMIAPARDEKAWFEAMKKMFSDKQLHETMSSKAREMVTERFSQPFVWDAILEEYKALEKQLVRRPLAAKAKG
ncbi:MAG: glycosyltransferase family 1 protein [Sphingobacteriales bacterium]|nr:MAG: glycosyltransferase family 1 protein [Sphingobacteriales bacterium]